MQIRGQFSDFFFEGALPSLNHIVKQAYAKKKKLMPMLFEQAASDRSIEQVTSTSGLGLLREITEGGEVQVDTAVQEFDFTFRHKKWGLAIEYSQELFEDDKFRLINSKMEELGQSAAETIEIQAASVFNNGFAGGPVGPDGVVLFSASHPMVKSGGLQSNLLTVAADLTVTSLELALVDWENTKRSNGHDLQLPTPSILAAPVNRFNAMQITKGDMRSDTANHTINAFKYSETGPVDNVMIWSKLTDPDAWFLVAKPSDNGLLWYWRKKLYRKAFADDRNERAGTALRYRASYGWESFYGVFGTPGA